MKNLLKAYLKRLTNLSAGNKSLMQLKLSSSQDLDIKDLEFLQRDLSAFKIIEHLISSTNPLMIAQGVDSRDESNNLASKALKAIFRKDQLIFSERGVHDLYLAWPFVEGKLLDGTPIRCPLLFFSVELQENKNQWTIRRNADMPISLNRSFLLAYAHFNKVSFSDDFMENNLEDFGSDSLAFRNELYQYLKHSNLELNFNRELFENELKPFLSYKRKDFESEMRLGELKLKPNAVLGIYPQAGSYLVPDYEQMIASTSEEKTFEDFFAERDLVVEEPHRGLEFKSSLSYINRVKEEQTFTPFMIDASQENALKAVKKGKSIVVQGPPGTGKSQLICNLVADYIARGKKVLVVCQKKVALEVVENRLNDIALNDFAVLLHDFKNDRRAIFDQINRQIEQLEEYEFKNNQLDTIYLDRNFLKVSREIDAITEELEEFKFALFDTSECGISVKQLYLTSNPKTKHLEFKMSYGRFKLNEIEAFKRLLASIYPYRKKLDFWSHPYKKRKSFAKHKALDKQQILGILEEIPRVTREFKNKSAEYLKTPITVEDAQWILDRKQLIHELIVLLSNPKAFEYFKLMLRTNPKKDWLIVKEKVLNQLFKDGFERTLKNEELGTFEEILDTYSEAQKHFWKRWIFRVFNQGARIFREVFKANNIEWDKAGLKHLTQLFDNRRNFEHIVARFNEQPWLLEVPKSKNKEVFDKWFELVFEALEAHSISQELRSFKEYWQLGEIKYLELKNRLEGVIKVCESFVLHYQKWEEYFSKAQLDVLVKVEAPIDTFVEALEADFEDLCAYDRLLETITADDKQIITKLFDEKEEASIEEVQYLFENSIALHWVDHIETKYPILRDVSSLEMDKRERLIRESVKLKRQYSEELVLQKVREITYRNTENNRLGNRVTYRELQHQVSKQRRLWSLRKLLGEYSEEILDLVPCWLASPEAVSAVFPLEFKFDLVIFDEASQCFVERGIPALHRARQFVITGDAKQLSPYDLYQVRFEDEEEEDENPLLEIDSLLDVSSKFLLEVYLTGHYRSKSVDLIQFSNENFYKGKLKMIPSKKDFVNGHNGFEYIKTDGIWVNNTNEIEAEKVVEICLDYFKANEDKSVGVVTFNYKQQQLIMDLISIKCQEKNLLIPSNFFVKNIENVQGDERDVIVFSLAYAPNKTGRLQMNFGSLNQKGGANRLNVAVTRAKEKNIIVASIFPNQMQVDEAKNEGPKLLKAYLAYVFEIGVKGFNPRYPMNELSAINWLLKLKLKQQLNTNCEDCNVEDSYYFADIICEKETVVSLFLTDDDLYYSAQGVKDAHVYLPLNLRRKEWDFHQKYSRNFWANQKLQLPPSLLIEEE